MQLKGAEAHPRRGACPSCKTPRQPFHSGADVGMCPPQFVEREGFLLAGDRVNYAQQNIPVKKSRPKQILRALRFARAAEPGLEFGLLLIFLGWGNKLVWLAKLKLETYLGERGHYAARMRREDGHRCCEVNACVPFSLTWATTAPVETSCIFASSRASARLELNSDRCTIRRIRNIKPFGFADESAHGY